MAKVAYGNFSEVNGSKVRIMRDATGAMLGTITKTKDGYRIYRVKDGKVREKHYLSDAIKSVSRAN